MVNPWNIKDDDLYQEEDIFAEMEDNLTEALPVEDKDLLRELK
jgi:hypothetical protein